jgi:hypothetical protein
LVGVNDGDMTVCFNNVQSFVNQFTARGIHVVLVPPFDTTGGGGLGTIQKNTLYGYMVDAYGSGQNPLCTIMSTDLIPHLFPDGSASNTTYFTDGTHQTSAGQLEYATGLGTHVTSLNL